MYSLEWVQQISLRRRSDSRAASRTITRIPAIVWYLGITSCLTDISSEMVNAILPMYIVGFLRLSPLQFGIVDGLYQGVSSILRLAGGAIADRWHRHKEAATAGYALSAVCKLGLLVTGASWPALASVIALDRSGKGLRTAPRDAMITLNSEPRSLGASFGVHRALDAAGALFGPIVAFLILTNTPGAFDLVFVSSFCFAIVGVAVLVLFVEPARHESAGTVRSTMTTMGARVSEVIGQAGFGYLVLAASVLSLATVSDAFVYLVLQQRLAFNSGVFPLLYVATSLVYMAAALPAGRLADRFGRRKVFLAGYLAIGLVYAILLAPSTGFAGGVLAIAALGVYYAATDGVLMAIAGRILPKASCATGMAVLTTSTSLARLLSSVLFGSLWTAGSVGTAASTFGAALMVALAIAMFGLSNVKDHD